MREQSGFSLIEILIVLVLVAFIVALALPGVSRIGRVSIEAFSNELVAVFRETRDRALLKKQIVRLKIDLSKQEYWVEAAATSFLIPGESEDTKGQEPKKEDKEKEENPFSLAREITPKHKKISNGVKIVKVITPRKKNPVTEGEAEVYYLPTGLSDAAIIHLEDTEGSKQSLLINPITGIASLEQGHNEGEKK